MRWGSSSPKHFPATESGNDGWKLEMCKQRGGAPARWWLVRGLRGLFWWFRVLEAQKAARMSTRACLKSSKLFRALSNRLHAKSMLQYLSKSRTKQSSNFWELIARTNSWAFPENFIKTFKIQNHELSLTPLHKPSTVKRHTSGKLECFGKSFPFDLREVNL